VDKVINHYGGLQGGKVECLREGNVRDLIPWPVKSGLYRDVNASNVKDFLQRAIAR